MTTVRYGSDSVALGCWETWRLCHYRRRTICAILYCRGASAETLVPRVPKGSRLSALFSGLPQPASHRHRHQQQALSRLRLAPAYVPMPRKFLSRMPSTIRQPPPPFSYHLARLCSQHGDNLLCSVASFTISRVCTVLLLHVRIDPPSLSITTLQICPPCLGSGQGTGSLLPLPLLPESRTQCHSTRCRRRRSCWRNMGFS